MITIQSSAALVGCLSLTVVLSLGVGLFLSAKGDLRRVENQCRSRFGDVTAKSAENELRFNVLELQISEVSQQVKQIDHAVEHPAHFVIPSANGPSHGKRTAIIRMAQRGERADSIAKTVGMPTSEVDLLLKVHRAVSVQN